MLSACFGISKTAKNTFSSDDSGPAKKPLPGTNIDSPNRLEYQAFKWHHDFLAGPGLPSLFRRYESSFAERLASFSSDVSTDRVNNENLLDVLKDLLMGPAILDAILGPALLKHNPHFLKSFCVIHDNTWKLTSGLPRWLAVKPLTAKKLVLTDIKSWHAWAIKLSDPHAHHPVSDQEDAFWGSKSIRERQLLVGTVDGFTQDDMASQDLALLWG
jgi:hypothetical protein